MLLDLKTQALRIKTEQENIWRINAPKWQSLDTIEIPLSVPPEEFDSIYFTDQAISLRYSAHGSLVAIEVNGNTFSCDCGNHYSHLSNKYSHPSKGKMYDIEGYYILVKKSPLGFQNITLYIKEA